MSSNKSDLRLVIGALCFVGGFFFPTLFIFAFFILGVTLTATPEEQHEASRPKPKAAPIERTKIAVDDPQWNSRYLEECESPAESAFLSAMISSFSLQPQNGVLTAPGLTLNMQVEIGFYRLDFLANDWLVIEIDGAAWHSSPEAVSRDQRRDRYFESYDYTVLRIPAKTVFSKPHEAVKMVRDTLAKGRKAPIETETVAQEPLSIIASVVGFVRAAGEFAEGVGASVERASALQQAMMQPRRIFDAEKLAIKIAIETVDTKMELERYFSQDPRRREAFDRISKGLKASIKKNQGSLESQKEDPFQLMRETIKPFQAPQAHPNVEIDEAIRRAYAYFVEERAAYFREVRQTLTLDKDRCALVKRTLLEMDCESCWTEVAPMPALMLPNIANTIAITPYASQTKVSITTDKPNA